MDQGKKKGMTFLRFAPLVLCLVLMGIYLLSGEEVTVDSLKNFAPNAPLLAVGFLLALYAFKSLTIVFPIVVLNALGGFLFSPVQALLINFAGVIIDMALPYWVGKLSGQDLVYKLEAKYPKFSHIFGEGAENHFFLSFFLRAIFCLPGDVVSMYFGAISMPFGKYLLGSFLGMLPGTIAATLLGTSITDPTSPLFWISIALTVGVALVSIVVYYLWKKAHVKKLCAAGRP